MLKSYWLALLAVLTIAAYSRSLYVPFVFDDTLAIEKNPRVNGTEPISIHGARSVLTASYRLNFWFDETPFWFHVVNLALHLLNGLIVYRIARNLVGDAAIIAAGIFWLHPLMSEGVIYVSARSELLSAFFGLSAFAVFMSERWRIMAIPLATLAIFTKEIAVVYPVLMAWWWVWKNGYLSWIAPAVCVLCFAVTAALQRPSLEYASAGAIEHALLQAAGFARYLVMAVVPLGLNIDHDTETIPIEFGVAAMVALVALLILASRSDRLRFPAIWIAIAIAPRFIVNTVEFMAERHLYLPMAGIALAVAALLEGSYGKQESERKVRAEGGWFATRPV